MQNEFFSYSFVLSIPAAMNILRRMRAMDAMHTGRQQLNAPVEGGILSFDRKYNDRRGGENRRKGNIR